MTSHKVDPQQIYNAIGLADKKLTDEQVLAIQAPHGNRASLVVAGAGSGKTELMSVRVLWLVANGYARPEQILGLTFTRKAAGELAKRIQDRLQQLRDTELWPEGVELASPTIATYNSYANNLFRQYSLLLGLEPEATLLTDATSFQVVKQLLLEHSGEHVEALAEFDKGLDGIIDAVLQISQELIDNQVTPVEVEREIKSALETVMALPNTSSRSKGEFLSELTDFKGAIEQNPNLARLADLFRQHKLAEGLVDYADQIAFALNLVESHPELVVEQQRAQFSHVLLDEYQDTSYLQTRLLQKLFSGHSVIAVGDPNQSIYGWRGASASNLASFGTDFGTGFGSGPTQVEQFRLQTSWRNPQVVLQLANALSAALTQPASYLPEVKAADRLEVATLVAKTDAPAGQIEIDVFETGQQEAEAVADWFVKKFAEPQADKKAPNGAVLMRSRANMEVFRAALEAKGIQAEPVGLDGLLQTPEVFDLICALRVIHTPNSGSALMRLLAGPRWRLGVSDLDALHQYAQQIDKSRYRINDHGQVYAPEDVSSTVDALESLLGEKRSPSGFFSDEGFERLLDAGQLLRTLRRQVGMPLLEYVNFVMQELWLDIEVQANPSRVVPMSNLNAFLEKVASFTASSSSATLGALIEWLDYLASKERNEIPNVVKKDSVVQLLTVHAAKGLEWKYVAVPEMVYKKPKKLGGWVATAKVPHQLRGDSASLPQLDLSNLTNQNEFKDRFTQYKDVDMREHLEREERRVTYVALTRPETELMISASYWKPGKTVTPSKLSAHFIEIADALSEFGVISQEHRERLTAGSQFSERPEGLNNNTQSWPLPPFSDQHAKLFKSAAEEVRGADPNGLAKSDLANNVERLLRERRAQLDGNHRVELPVRIPASVFHKYIYEFDDVVKNAYRPMPEQPYRQSITGTEFHGWLERQFGQGVSVDIDSLADATDNDLPEGVDIRALQETFAKSQWAGQQPVDVEIEIQVAIERNIFICKLDAVFATDDGYQIVDWKTGKSPKTPEDEEAKALQLALYRMAYARHLGIDPSKITCALYFVSDDLVLEPKIKSEQEIIELWQGVLAKVANPDAEGD